MRVKIKLFAFLQDRLGSTVTVDLSQPVTTDDFLMAVAQLDPSLKSVLVNSRIAVNQEFVTQGPLTITPADEVAIIPPVSGG
ncbi:MoaD/ThiS family protein [Limosilactobacillus panis]|uniref:Molybdopterin synthase sulfur carrier subunit n=1 Tax=Limosilactobacillus panis TaxID=47493 RepID=A0ABT7VLQ9_9LACO|nr:MoaD/ThiS family protein [Limosilactobacillus panis]MDM8333658.1 MoaD/ThiS family protein [Limosilactobacillus panis]HJA21194.1 MoaD/ThiS family protein [Candidatus Limosilactobacillus intestinipullorum]